MAVCGAGCMGFVNVARGLRAIGYTEADPLPAGPVALVTHSGSVFSALLRTRRAFGFTLAVSSGQELVTPAAAYARYALSLPETKILALVLEAVRDATALRSVLADAAGRDIPVFLLAAGTSEASRSLVAAHSGALAAGDGAWQALASAYGVHRVGDLAELADALELFSLVRRPARPARPAGSTSRGNDPDREGSLLSATGLATVHDSGFERAHVADLAAAAGVPFAPLTAQTRQRLAAVLDPGLEPGNPLDVWGTGRDAEALFTEALLALADDPGTGAVALAVDLVPEYDGDDSYRAALLAAAAKTAKPVAVLASIPAAIDTTPRPGCAPAASPSSSRPAPACSPSATCLTAPPDWPVHPAARDRPRAATAGRTAPSLCPAASAAARRGRWLRRRWSAASRPAAGRGPVRPAARLRHPRRGGPVGRHRGRGPGGRGRDRLPGRPQDRLRRTSRTSPTWAASASASRTRPNSPPPTRTCPPASAPASPSPKWPARARSSSSAWPATRPSARSSSSAPAAILAEYLADRAVALPPLTEQAAAALIARLRVARLLSGFRGQPAADLAALIGRHRAFSALVTDLGEHLAAFDVNPLICTPSARSRSTRWRSRPRAAASPPPGRPPSGPRTSAPRPW